jgi:hypothetical protein
VKDAEHEGRTMDATTQTTTDRGLYLAVLGLAADLLREEFDFRGESDDPAPPSYDAIEHAAFHKGGMAVKAIKSCLWPDRAPTERLNIERLVIAEMCKQASVRDEGAGPHENY